MTSCEGTIHNPDGLKISFGGCGALGVYHIGVCKCLIDHVADEFEHLYGASAGALAAVCFVCKCDPLMIYEWSMETFKLSREYSILGLGSPSFNLLSRLRDFLEKILPPDAHRLCRNRVHVSLSVFNGFGLPKNWLLTDFTTRKELINALIGSSMLPGFGGINGLPVIRGRWCFDGGLSSNIPLVSDPNVISVTPFSGESSICPPMESSPARHVVYCDQPFQVTSQNLSRLKMALYPTSAEALEELFHQGYRDSLRFFKQKGLIPESITELKTATVTSGVKLSDQGVPGDSGYLSRTDSYSQSDYCNDTECGSEAEKASENERLQMHPLDHQLLIDSRVTSSKKPCLKLRSKDTRTSNQM